MFLRYPLNGVFHKTVVIGAHPYAIKEAEYTNKRYRAIGIGVSNYPYFLCNIQSLVPTPKQVHKALKVLAHLSALGL